MDFVTLKSGDIIGGRYELLDKLGAGAFGAVYRARQLGIDRMVAVKLLMPEAKDIDGTASARFTREAKLSSSLEHPNTITIHDYGQTEDGILYLVMEYVRGETLQSLLRRDIRLEPIRAVKIVRQVLQSLHEAHARGIVHRDMKPANIMLFDRVGERDVVKVLDFGIAKFVSNDDAGMGSEAAKQDLTVAGRIVGTPRYMSPEQINGHGVYPASDLYALGLIFYEMIAGRRAVTGDSTLSLIAAQISTEAVIDPNDPFVPASLRPIIRDSTTKNVQERYASALEFLAALDDLDMHQLAALEPLEGRPGWKEPEPPGPAMTGEFVYGESEYIEPQEGSPGIPITMLAGAAAVVFLVALVASIAFFAIMPDRANNVAAAAASDESQDGTADHDNKDEAKADDGPDEVAKGDSKDEAGSAAKADDGASDAEGSDSIAHADDDKAKPPPEEQPKAREFTIASTPQGASVTRGDELLGKTPLVFSIKPDAEATLKVALDGYKPQLVDIAPSTDKEAFALTLVAVKPAAKKQARGQNPKHHAAKTKAGTKTGPKAGSKTGNKAGTKTGNKGKASTGGYEGL